MLTARAFLPLLADAEGTCHCGAEGTCHCGAGKGDVYVDQARAVIFVDIWNFISPRIKRKGGKIKKDKRREREREREREQTHPS